MGTFNGQFGCDESSQKPPFLSNYRHFSAGSVARDEVRPLSRLAGPLLPIPRLLAFALPERLRNWVPPLRPTAPAAFIFDWRSQSSGDLETLCGLFDVSAPFGCFHNYGLTHKPPSTAQQLHSIHIIEKMALVWMTRPNTASFLPSSQACSSQRRKSLIDSLNDFNELPYLIPWFPTKAHFMPLRSFQEGPFLGLGASPRRF
jgi:hypothetical protein